MNEQELKLKRILNEEQVENVRMYQYGFFITTESKEIEITANDDEPIINVNDKQ